MERSIQAGPLPIPSRLNTAILAGSMAAALRQPSGGPLRAIERDAAKAAARHLATLKPSPLATTD